MRVAPACAVGGFVRALLLATSRPDGTSSIALDGFPDRARDSASNRSYHSRGLSAVGDRVDAEPGVGKGDPAMPTGPDLHWRL